MKKTLLTLLVLSSSVLVFSQGSWSPRAPLPDSARGYGVGFSIGKYGYVGLGGSELSGNNWKYFTNFWQFNPSTNSWTRKAAFPGKARICPATFVIGNYAYVVTGGQQNASNNFVRECWQYNSVTDKWIQKHDFPGLTRCWAVGFAIGKNGYIGTGYDTLRYNVLRDFWEYDTATDTWTQKHDFGGAARYCASGFAVEGKGYICFGLDSTNSIAARDMWEYDTATDSWTQKSNNPTDSMGFTNGFVIGNDIYVGTGQAQNFKIYSDFWKYNTINDTWTQQKNFLGGYAAECSAFAIDDTGYMGLGILEDNTLRGSNTFFRFKPEDSLTGILRIFSDAEVHVFPNPFGSSCLISLPNITNNSPIEFTLYNVSGQKEDANISCYYPNYILNRGKLPAGMYFLSVKGNNQVFYKKLLIIN